MTSRRLLFPIRYNFRLRSDGKANWQVLCIAIVLPVLLAVPVARGDAPSAPARSTEATVPFWMISTRAIRSSFAEASSRVEDIAALPLGIWDITSARPARHDMSKFVQHVSHAPALCVFVHGNRTTPELAVAEATLLSKLFSEIPLKQKPMLVLWSWPSQKTLVRHVNDAKLKLNRCHLEASLLSSVLQRLPEDVPVLLVGYSFGARIVLEAMSNWTEQQASISDRQVQAVLVAGAIGNDCLLETGDAPAAYRAADRLVFTRNRFDRILKWYRVVDPKGSEAAGRTGPLLPGNADVDGKLEVLDVSCLVGSSHAWPKYMQTAPLQQQLSQIVLKLVAEH